MNLIKTDDVTAIGIDALILRRLKCKEQRAVSLRLNKGTTKEFTWCLNPVDWWGCVNLVDGFEENRSNHNYFTDDDVDDALIVLQYKQSAAYRGLEYGWRKGSSPLLAIDAR